MALLVLAHVDADQRLLVVEQELGERAGRLGLADAGRAEEEEASRSGRFGSCRPARAARTALATAAIASSWPTTRSRSRSSMLISFSTSPSSSRLTGMPVQRLTTSAMSSSSTSSLTSVRPLPPRSRERLLGLRELLLELADLVLAGARRVSQSASQRGLLELVARRVELLLDCGRPC